MKMRYAILILLVMLQQSGCDKDEPGNGPVSENLSFVVLSDNQQQKIANFGASDAWSIQFVGKNWPLAKRERIAELLFSNENESNNPKGIGLSAWRFNLGAGSAQQGGGSDIFDEWRRAPGMLKDDGSYDVSLLAGQRNFLKLAHQRYGVNQLIAFVNSPPVQYTKNGKAYSGGGSNTNLKTSHFTDYANYLLKALQEIKKADGIEFTYLSPFNEPQWNWDQAGQEGCPWQNDEISTVCKLIDSVFVSNQMQTKIELADAGKLTYIYGNDGDAGRGSQVDAFFSPNSKNYVGYLPSLAKKITGHSYYTTHGNSELIRIREDLKTKMDQYQNEVSFWQTEYCLLENNDEIDGNGRDLGMTSALYLSKVIHSDLTVANSEVWQWWLGVSPYDYKDGLVYIDYNKDDGQIYESKLLWALGHYSRFIKPGARRYEMWRSDNKSVEQSLNGIFASSYRNADGSWVIVVSNQSSNNIPVKITISDNDQVSFRIYETNTDPNINLDFIDSINVGEVLEVKGKSMVTLVSE